LGNRYRYGLTLSVGIAVGVLTATAVIHAQQKKLPRGYIVGEPKVVDPATFQKYVHRYQARLRHSGGIF
jgi:hypothetical protein